MKIQGQEATAADADTETTGAEGVDAALDVTAESSTATDVAAESSSAEGVKKPDSPLAAVMAALAKDQADSSPESSVDGQSTIKADADAAEGDPDAGAEAEQADAEDAKLPFAKHPRFKQLLGQVKQFKGELETVASEAEQMRPKAKHFDELTRYVTDSGLSADDFSNTLRIARLMKNDPAQAYEAMRPWMDAQALLLGERLPDDIQKKVDAGLIDKDTATELAKQRGKATLSEAQRDRVAQRSEQERETRHRDDQQREIHQAANAIGESVTAWERQWKGSDPDYAKKQPLVMDRVMVLMTQTPPRTKEDALKLAKQAREEIEKQLKGMLPQPRAKTPMKSGTSVDTRPQPKTPLEATKMALSGTGGG